MAALISSKIWFLFIGLTVVVVVGSPTTDLLESVDLSLERLCTLFHKCWPKQLSIQLEISVRQAKHNSKALDVMWNMTLRPFFFLSRTRIITFSPPRTRSKPASLEAFYYFPSILTDFNSLLPSPLSLVLLHSNCDFHGYLTRSRSTCIKCPPGINLLLVLKPLSLIHIWRCRRRG